ncbi:hypothetical protein ACKI1I_15680 [Streptomyces turgidiscabies]|uniref:Uncharacterized protein n=1 Tax=Streptomyces turgidiscabies (strain Car8) TaxID=698760 RepID=L7F4C2_STRT8|nr:MULTISPECIES: hypothetical protein [Streptomyces]ELP66458.1 hypothetical protein STRTUCAR8_08245 [Streptomyces turgidiscabies Car8]MDX3495236.1 hypothetical protein [Streptomyces turgidiscabies]GAQ71114.1 putative membrane protein/MT1774 [Streptomyces turgidiscabies]
MHGSRRTRKRFWRWRSNPLRRHDDIIEAWIVLAVWAVIAIGGAVAGLVTAHAADEVFAAQRAERRSVRAVLLTDVPPAVSTLRGANGRSMATVRWTAPDGSTRTGEILVKSGLTAGSELAVWQDSQGELTTEPISPTDAAVEAGFLGAAAALALAGIACGTGALARWRLDQRRINRWDQEWDQVGPRWSHKTG